jgi:hypothetical protein
MTIIAIAVAALAALKTYQRAERLDPEGTRSKVESIWQGAELVRTIAAFITSLFYVLKGMFRPVGQIQPRQGGLSFGSRLASDEV